MRHIGRIALVISALGVMTALLLAVLAVPVTDEDSQLWVQVGMLGIPSAGGVWFFGRGTVPTRPWLFTWIVALAIGMAATVRSGLDTLSSANADSGYGTTAIAVLTAVQAAVSLWAADVGRRAQSSK